MFLSKKEHAWKILASIFMKIFYSVNIYTWLGRNNFIKCRNKKYIIANISDLKSLQFLSTCRSHHKKLKDWIFTVSWIYMSSKYKTTKIATIFLFYYKAVPNVLTIENNSKNHNLSFTKVDQNIIIIIIYETVG